MEFRIAGTIPITSPCILCRFPMPWLRFCESASSVARRFRDSSFWLARRWRICCSPRYEKTLVFVYIFAMLYCKEPTGFGQRPSILCAPLPADTLEVMRTAHLQDFGRPIKLLLGHRFVSLHEDACSHNNRQRIHDDRHLKQSVATRVRDPHGKSSSTYD